MTAETRALVLSAAAALVLGIVALIMALAAGSGAILLDGAFNLCFFVTALVTLRVARLLERPDDQQYPFGYLHFEPLINMVKGLLILGVGLIALIDAAFSLYRGGTEVSAGLALAYASSRASSAVASSSPFATSDARPRARWSKAISRTGPSIRDLGRDILRLLRGADAAARGNGSSRPVGRPHPC